MRAIESNALVLDQERETMDVNALSFGCTASVTEPRPMLPIFQDNKIVLQLLRAPLFTSSVAQIA